MQDADSRFVLAEIAIGLAGFTGITGALYARDTWHPFDRFRTVSLLIISFGALAFALAPHGLQLLGVPDERLWRICSGAVVAFSVIAAFVVMRDQPTDYPSVPYYRTISVVFYVLSVLNTLALALNALGLFSASFGVYYIGLVVMLLIGGLQFAVIVLVRPS